MALVNPLQRGASITNRKDVRWITSRSGESPNTGRTGTRKAGPGVVTPGRPASAQSRPTEKEGPAGKDPVPNSRHRPRWREIQESPPGKKLSGAPRAMRRFRFGQRRMLRMATLLFLSTSLHLLLIGGMNTQEKETATAGKTKETTQPPAPPVAVAAPPSPPEAKQKTEERKPVQKPARKKTLRKRRSAPKQHEGGSWRAVANRALPSGAVLERLGREVRHAAMEGSFPGIEFQYSDPAAFIRQMYSLGCKTLLSTGATGEYFEVDLFSGDLTPLTGRELRGYSQIKRIIEDRRWDPVKARAARRTGGRPDEVELLLCVPISIEARWFGYLASIFRKQNLPSARIAAAEVRVSEAKLYLQRVYLHDGSVRRFSGWPGV